MEPAADKQNFLDVANRARGKAVGEAPDMAEVLEAPKRKAKRPGEGFNFAPPRWGGMALVSFSGQTQEA